MGAENNTEKEIEYIMELDTKHISM